MGDERRVSVHADDGWPAWNPATPQMCSPVRRAAEGPGGRGPRWADGSSAGCGPEARRRARRDPCAPCAGPAPPRRPGARGASRGPQPLPSVAPLPQPSTRAAARTAFPPPGFDRATSPLGRPECVPAALYVKSQFPTLRITALPHGPPSRLPHSSSLLPNRHKAKLLLRSCKG